MDDDEPEARRELIAFVRTTKWNGPAVLAYCERCPMRDLRQFARALKSEGSEPVPLAFRWASDEDSGGWIRKVGDAPREDR